MSRLFTEEQWRAIAAVERLTEHRYTYDGFHSWCARKRILGGAFACGEFYIGWREDPTVEEFRVFERPSGLDFSCEETRADAIATARRRILLADWYMPELLRYWTKENAEAVRKWDQDRADMETAVAIAKARAEARLTKPIPRRRQAIFDKSGGKCHYCKAELEIRGRWHIEHKLPKALGGDNSPDNLVAACAPCNHAKRDKTDVEFFALLAKAS